MQCYTTQNFYFYSADSNAVLPVCKGETETYLLFVLSGLRIGHEAGSGMLSKHWCDDKLSLICLYLVGSIK